MNWIVMSLALLALVYVGLRAQFWLREGRSMKQSGYLTPAPSIFARAFFRVSTRILAYLGIGPIEVIGRENLKVRGRKIFAANHQFELDFAAILVAVRCHFRYMTKASELTGLRAPFGAWTGSIPVDTSVPQGGENALNASVASMVEGEARRFLIFPQGRLVTDNVLQIEDMRTGAVRLTRHVYEETDEEPTFLIPMAIHYHSRRKASVSHFFLAPLRRMFGVTRYGAVVVIGKPIPAADLSQNPAVANALLFERLRELSLRASSLYPERALAR